MSDVQTVPETETTAKPRRRNCRLRNRPQPRARNARRDAACAERSEPSTRTAQRPRPRQRLKPPPAPEKVERGIGVLLVNLGTPDAPDAAAVRRYLKEFLTDPRVIEKHGLFWKLVLNGVILPIRSRRKARDYKKIWNNDKNESPFKTITRSQAEKLAGILEPLGKHVIVDWAMRYANPSIASRLEALIARGCDRILIMPLYPQYAAATTATVVRRGVPLSDAAAPAAGAAHPAGLLRRSLLHRGAGLVAEGRAQGAAVRARRDPRCPITACRRTTCTRAIPTRASACGPRSCCASSSASTKTS